MMPQKEEASCLLLSYDFSERIMGGSVRMVKFARYLPAHGWTPQVVTASPPDEHPALPSGRIHYVPSWERRFGGGITVGPDGQGVLGQNPAWLRRLAGLKTLLPLERQAAWFPALRRALPALLAAGPVRVVVSTAAPYVMLLFGQWLARRLGVPHVVDIRDDWQDRYRIERRSWLNRAGLDAYAGSVLRHADAVITVSPPIVRRLEAYGTPVHFIPNGYDEADFAGVPMAAEPVPSGGPLRLMHLGWLGDFRSAAPLLDSLRTLIERDPALRDAFRFEQYGLIDPGQKRLLEAAGPMVRVHPQMPHEAALRRMCEADVLVVIPGSGIPAALTGKVFEYLRARRPILLWAGDGAAQDLAAEVGMRWAVREGDTVALTRALEEMLVLKRAGRLRTHTDPARIREFARERGAARLASILDAVTGRSRPAPRASAARPHRNGVTA